MIHANALVLALGALSFLGLVLLPLDKSLLLGSLVSLLALGVLLVAGWRKARLVAIGVVCVTLVPVIVFAAYLFAGYTLSRWQMPSSLPSVAVLAIAGAIAVFGSAAIVAGSGLSRTLKLSSVFASLLGFAFLSLLASLWIGCSHGNCF